MRRLCSTLAVLATAAIALPTSAGAQQKITIGIPTSPPNIVHMPVIVAKELGLYKSRPRRGHRLLATAWVIARCWRQYQVGHAALRRLSTALTG